MFQWLNGPGAAFRQPLPGSTNYLGAYTKDGRLIRVVRGDKGRKESETRSDVEDGKRSGSSDSNVSIEADELPRELLSDMQPFPNNPEFRSQPVLSEDLREEIYRRVHIEGKSVKVVSAELGVEMNRVGAVVRLKAVEKEWIKKVSSFRFASCLGSYMMSTLHRLVLKTNPWLHTIRFASLTDISTSLSKYSDHLARAKLTRLIRADD